ncbi:MAG: hypothetical protein R3F38_17270 [Gammaproteobacteria bacterium]
MLEVTLYSMQGDEAKTKEAIRNHVKTIQETPANPDLRLLDEMSTRGIRLISDKLWTQHTGQRTLTTSWDASGMTACRATMHPTSMNCFEPHH